MARQTKRQLGWVHVRAARFRRAARGRTTWLADDLASSHAQELRPTDRLGGFDGRLNRMPAGRPARRRAGRAVLTAVQDPDDGAVGVPERQSDPAGDHSVDALADEDGGSGDGPAPVGPGARPRQGVASLMPPRPDREEAAARTIHGERGPVAPGWLQHPITAARRVGAQWAHVVAFHGLRLPEYGVRAARWAPRGLSRSLVGLFRWATDAEGKELRWAAAAREDTREYLHLSRQRNQRVHNRAPVAGALVLLVISLIGALVVLSPGSPLTRVAVVLSTVAVFGAAGAPADRPVIDHAVVPPKARRITPDLLVQAFAAAKLCSRDPDRSPGMIRFMSPIAHDGPGVRALIDLPAGVTASDALSRREKIAAGLDIDEFRLFLERQRGTTGSARRVVVWVADRDPYEQDSPASPLATARSWDFWRAFPFGVDARGRKVNVPLVWSSLLVGAIPRMGKTNAARLPAAAAALDPTARLIVFDGKGGKDWKPFEGVAHFYAAGVRTTVVEALVSVLQNAVEDMNLRYERMAELPDDICPEGKVTPQITRRASYGMPLTLLCVDEVHRYLEHPEHGKTICALLSELAKAGPAAGYMLVLATQRPDSKTVPEALRGQMGTRFALRTMNWQASETILGAGTYTAGFDSSKFLRTHLGVGILLGSDDEQATDGEAVTVRTHVLDLVALRRLCARGRAAREQAGTLTGMAAGDTVIAEAPQRRLLDDVLDVLEPGEDRAWSETICARLGERWADSYDGWDPTTLANALRAFGVDTKQVWGRTASGEGANRRGIRRQALLDAIAERDRAGSKATTHTASVTEITPEGAVDGPQSLAPGGARSSTPDSDPDQRPSS